MRGNGYGRWEDGHKAMSHIAIWIGEQVSRRAGERTDIRKWVDGPHRGLEGLDIPPDGYISRNRECG